MGEEVSSWKHITQGMQCNSFSIPRPAFTSKQVIYLAERAGSLITKPVRKEAQLKE
jgi:hypothetical protein